MGKSEKTFTACCFCFYSACQFVVICTNFSQIVSSANNSELGSPSDLCEISLRPLLREAPRVHPGPEAAARCQHRILTKPSPKRPETQKHSITFGSAPRREADSTGEQLQSVWMRPIPQLSVKTCGEGGGSWGGGGGGETWQLSRGEGSQTGVGCARPTTTRCIPQGCVCVSRGMDL